MFVCFEGIDGSGKTTQARRLVERLTADGLSAARVFDPGTTRVGHAIRDILLNNDEPMSAMAQMLLFSAARAELAEHISKEIAAGTTIVCDRWLLSTLVYQGHGNQLDLNFILSVYKNTTGLVPDVCFLLDLPAEAAECRVGPPRDRYERKSLADRKAMRDIYLTYAKQYRKKLAHNLYVLDADAAEEQTHDEVYRRFVSVKNATAAVL